MKNSKSIVILFSLFFSLFTIAQSEKGFYARVNSGYTICTGNENYLQALETKIATINETSTSTTELIEINCGKGLIVGLQNLF